MSSNLSRDSAWLTRFAAWVKERFPPAAIVLASVIYCAAFTWGRFLAGQGPIEIGVFDLAGVFAATAFFLMLRVFDEHKDYEDDCRDHPGRVLQRGLITLGQLKAVGAVAIAAQLGYSLFADRGFGAATAIWLAVLGYSALTAKEFFCGDRLKLHKPLYVASHMVVMPLAILWMVQIGFGSELVTGGAVWLAGLGLVAGLALELVRKSGRGRALASLTAVAALAALDTALLWRISTGDAWRWWAIVGAGFALCALTLLRSPASSSPRARRMNEAAVALFALLSLAAVTAAVLFEKGVLWT